METCFRLAAMAAATVSIIKTGSTHKSAADACRALSAALPPGDVLTRVRKIQERKATLLSVLPLPAPSSSRTRRSELSSDVGSGSTAFNDALETIVARTSVPVAQTANAASVRIHSTPLRISHKTKHRKQICPEQYEGLTTLLR